MKLEEAIKVLEHHKLCIDVSEIDQNQNRVSKAIETVLNELKTIKLVEDWETGQLIHKDAIREKLDNYKEKINLNEREIKKNPDPISSKITHSFDEYYQWKNKVTKENELLQAKIEALKELLKE